MGAWGYGVFENDDVLDWAAEVVEANDLAVIAEVLESVDEEEEDIEADLAANALGAAEVLAALNGQAGRELRDDAEGMEELQEWMKEHQGEGKAYLVLAVRAIQKIKINSELKHLWEESDGYSNWLGTLDDLEARIKKISK